MTFVHNTLIGMFVVVYSVVPASAAVEWNNIANIEHYYYLIEKSATVGSVIDFRLQKDFLNYFLHFLFSVDLIENQMENVFEQRKNYLIFCRFIRFQIYSLTLLI